MELFTLALFVLSTSGTPGPNNIMLLTSGINHGLRPGLPHVLGVNAGFSIMVIGVGLGLVSVFQQFPSVYVVLKVIGVTYLLYLAYKIATSTSAISTNKQAKPISFMQAALFQWVNPKAWVMALSAIVAFSSGNDGQYWQVFVIALVYFVCGLPCSFAWLSVGVSLQKVIDNLTFLRWFNRVMAVILVVSLIPMIESASLS